MKVQEAIDWHVPAEFLRNLCIDARGRFAQSCKPLNDLLASQPADDPNRWGLDAMPTWQDTKLPLMTDPEYWDKCRSGVKELERRLACRSYPEMERVMAGDVMTCWLRSQLLGQWLRVLELDDTCRAHVVRRFIENHHRLHAAVMCLMLAMTPRQTAIENRWMEDQSKEYPLAWEDTCLDWIFEYMPGTAVETAVSNASQRYAA